VKIFVIRVRTKYTAACGLGWAGSSRVGFLPPDDTRRRLFRPWHGTGERPTRKRLRTCDEMRWKSRVQTPHYTASVLSAAVCDSRWWWISI